MNGLGLLEKLHDVASQRLEHLALGSPERAVVIRKDTVVSQAKGVRDAHCPGTCMEGKGERSMGWDVSVALDESRFNMSY